MLHLNRHVQKSTTDGITANKNSPSIDIRILRKYVPQAYAYCCALKKGTLSEVVYKKSFMTLLLLTSRTNIDFSWNI